MSLNWKDWITPRYSTDAIVKKVAEEFEYLDDDIVVSTYHKSGTTLVQEMISCLVMGPEKTKSTMLLRRSPFIDFFLHLPNDPMEEAKTMPRPRVLKTHLPPAHHMRHLSDRSPHTGPKNVIVIRNPKDVVVSAFHHFNGTATFDGQPIPDKFDEYWPAAIFEPAKLAHHDILDFNMSWWSFRDHPRVLILFYEDIVRGKADHIRRLAEFLRVELTDQLLADTLHATSFQTMRDNPNVNLSLVKEIKEHWKPGCSFIRKGEVGDWKNHFTVAQSEQIDKYIADRMAGSDLKFTFE